MKKITLLQTLIIIATSVAVTATVVTLPIVTSQRQKHSSAQIVKTDISVLLEGVALKEYFDIPTVEAVESDIRAQIAARQEEFSINDCTYDISQTTLVGETGTCVVAAKTYSLLYTGTITLN
jgi:hypothetical protein